jgi:hypothetical protein
MRTRFTVSRMIDGKARLAEPLGQEAGDCQVVLDDEDAHQR